MLIGFEAKRLFNMRSGFGIYARSVVRSLVDVFPDNNYLLYTPYLSRNPILTPEVKFFLEHNRIETLTPANWYRFAWSTIGCRVSTLRRKIDVFHGLVNDIPKGIRTLDIPKVITICDLIYQHYPGSVEPEILRKHDKHLRTICNDVDAIIAISKSTKRDIVNYFQIDPKMIHVVYPACDPRFTSKKSADEVADVRQFFNLPNDYLLYVGTISERKNLLTVIKAIELMPPSTRLPLIVIGMDTPYKEVVLEYATKKNLGSLIRFTTVESNDHLPAIYQGARLFVYPSLYEGFGIPIIEALNSGVPIITSNQSSMPEAAGSQSFLVDPQSSEDVSNAILTILTDDHVAATMAQSGRTHARNFSKTTSASQLNLIYQNLLQQT